MSTEPNGWLEQVRAKVRDLLASGNRRLDELEAQREAEREDKPWLSGDAPTLDSVRARIEWEEAARREAAGAGGDAISRERLGGQGDRATRSGGDRADVSDRGQQELIGESESSNAGGGSVDGGTRPLPMTEDAEREAIRVELEEREQASRERLAEIRRELGFDSDGAEPDG